LPVEEGEDDRADRESERGAPDAALLVRLFEQFEGQRGDQCACGERQHGGECTLGDGEPSADQRAEDQGARGDHSEDQRLDDDATSSLIPR